MTLNETAIKYRMEKLPGAILISPALLNFRNVWNQGFSNTNYTAAVRSMLETPGIAIFNSFDAAGFVTIDKPSVGLRVQAVSAVIFGYSCRVLVLPLALAGAGSGSRGCMGGKNSGILPWVSEHCSEVPSAEGGGSSDGTSTRNMPSVFGNMTSPAFPGSGLSTSHSNGRMSRANTLYDYAGYSGQSRV
jgi:hypothetical protein